jgi:hypothetical protein
MSTFIRTIQGSVSTIDYGKKELSLSIKEIMSGKSVEKNIVFSIDPNAIITNTTTQQVKLSALLKGHKVEIDYTRNKGRRNASKIKIMK